MPDAVSHPVVRIDIVSDVVCPWCIVGYKQLEQALDAAGVRADLHWHPFELNPDMPPGGENLRDHLVGKYAISAEQSLAARQRLTDLGASLGFDFAYDDDSRIVNTFRAHQLLDWAAPQGRQTALKLALFKAYFSDARDVSDPAVLARTAAAAGLPAEDARAVLASGAHAAPVRRKQKFWIDTGIRSVPSMVFGGRYLLAGAQGAETFGRALERCLKDAA